MSFIKFKIKQVIKNSIFFSLYSSLSTLSSNLFLICVKEGGLQSGLPKEYDIDIMVSIMNCSLKSCFHLTECYWWSFTSDTKLRNPVNDLCRNFRRLHCFRAPTWDLPSTPQDLQASDEAPRVARQEQVGPLAVSKDADFSLVVLLFEIKEML